MPLKNMDDSNIYIQKLEILCDYYNMNMNKKINDLKRKRIRYYFIWIKRYN